MGHVRVYLPLSPERCRELHTGRRVSGPLPGFTVTESVRGLDPGGDEEGWEHAALQDAAQSCLDAGQPVIVAAVDLDRVQLDDGSATGSRIEVLGAVSLPRVAAFQVGDDVLSRDDAPDLDPESEIELSWYDTTELSHLVSLV